ncbi:M23 family metallopeptidase [Sandaracinobacteroides hominis]|uniref:M23 family metallopeptidase n=1 Tax=Sandaracinobacteroides hominis TaxID=2780086 RepID=UPI0018F6434B|nr:M23 family metallopeptidase [Sandaracinobacteroides hominis]
MATAADFALAPAGRISLPRAPQLPRFGLPLSGTALARTAAQIYDTDLVVDLGDAIGSGRWWRGFGTLGLLIGTALALGSHTPSLVAPAPPPLSPSKLEEARFDRISPLAFGSVTGRQVPANAMVRRLAETPERPRVELSANIGSGGLEGALRRAGVGRDDLEVISGLLRGISSLSGGKPGTGLNIVLGRRESKAVPRPLEFLSYRASFENKVEIKRGADGQLAVKNIPIRIDNTPLRVTGEVGGSLQRAARAAGLPANIVAEYMRQLGYAMDIQRDIGKRDKFEIIVSHRRAETGETEMGQLLYAGLMNGRSNVSLMRWGNSGEFFWQTGEGVRKGLIRTPVQGARQSSGFGMRFHPLLGYSRMHQGVDFAARAGTPILASAGGRVVLAGWGGGYGNVVVLDHGKGMRTRYAHMQSIGVRNGQQVSQGQQIGRVGSTGLSTGPHLHYEVWMNGKPVDPRSVKLLGGSQLGGADLQKFRGEMARLKKLPAAGSAG